MRKADSVGPNFFLQIRTNWAVDDIEVLPQSTGFEINP